jgi:hypothetical protein
MRDMEDWNSDYQKWIKNNEQHKKDRYLIHWRKRNYYFIVIQL